jgi:outer membrane receptor protein involved in Fe transport
MNVRQGVGDHWSIATTAFVRTLDSEQFNVNVADSNTRSFTSTLTVGGTVEAVHQGTVFGRPNRLLLGVDYSYADVRVRVFEEAAPNQREIDSDVRDSINAVGAWVQNTLDAARGLLLAGDQLVLTTSARFEFLRHTMGDRNPDPDAPRSGGGHTYVRTQPRFGINYNPTRNIDVYFSYAEGFRAPSFLELTCASPATICPGLQAGVAPDPPLKPVKARNYEVGVRARPWPWLEGSLSLYRTDVRDDIFSVSPTGTVGLFFQNIGDTRRQGVELGLRGRFWERVEPWLNYAYTEATFRNDVLLGTSRVTAACAVPPCSQFVRKGSELTLVPRQRVNAGVDVRLADWLTLSLSGAYVSRQWLRGDEANEERQLGDYFALNAGLIARVKALSAFVSVQNLLDSEYETFGTFAPNAKLDGAPVQRFLTPTAPINVHGGLAWRF